MAESAFEKWVKDPSNRGGDYPRLVIRNDDKYAVFAVRTASEAWNAALEEAAKVAGKMQCAAADVLEKGHDDDEAAQYDTSMEIAEAIRALKEERTK